MAGLYLHIPFCRQRCIYCDFYFVTTQQHHPAFVDALAVELAHYAREYGTREAIETVYLGGGTPSRLDLESLYRLFDALHRHFDLSAVRETTLELNPEDGTPEYLRGLRRLGVDRLSIGVQSFFDDDLRFMNRSHTAAQGEAVLTEARAAGFDNFSVDLIFGLPEQPLEYWGANLEKAARLEAPHLSTYGLTVEPRTVLAKQVDRGLLPAPDDDVMAERYRLTMDFLGARGYEHYEISSFARPGFRAVHNAAYWEHANYLGFGPSAHSFWWQGLPARRWSNVRNLRRYEALLREGHLPVDTHDHLGLDALADEYVLLRLRTADGLCLDTLSTRYGVDLVAERGDALAVLEADGLLTLRQGRVRLTDAGKLVCDAVTARLLPAPVAR